MNQIGQSASQSGSANGWNDLGFRSPDPQLLKNSASRLSRLAAPAISIIVLLAVGIELSAFDLASILALLPTTALFWFVFAAFYFSAPVADWIIFRRLWHIPADGLLALTRKLIGNELLLGYVGELYFYSWARKRSQMVGAPFGAVKDVAILSAVVGNVVTLVMLGFAYPLLGELHLGLQTKTVALSIAIALMTSAAAMLFRKRLFSLPTPDLWFVVAVHFVRILATTGLTALMWHLVLPTVPLMLWLLLSTMRLLLSRLPFVPNKDVVFAGIAVFWIGREHQVADLMALMAGIILAAHLVLGAALAVGDILGWERKP